MSALAKAMGLYLTPELGLVGLSIAGALLVAGALIIAGKGKAKS